MNYQKIYDNIIKNRINNTPIGYTEKHHIIPRSLGGTNNPDNLVDLTAREHFLCHYLLAKMYPKESFEWYKTNHAFMMMKCDSIQRNARYFNSRLYEALRINFSSIMSKNQKGKNNSQYGKVWISNIELKESKRIPKSDPIPNGWIKGRNKWNTVVSKRCLYCNKEYIGRGNTCSSSCGKRLYYKNNPRALFGGKLDDIINDYKQGYSIYRCLTNAGFNGTGKNHDKLKEIIKELNNL